MAKVFTYGKMDRRARKLTVVWFAVLAGLLFCVWFFWGEGGYVTAWTVSLIIAAFLLYLMSIPRSIALGTTAFEIRCVVEITHIKYSDLQSVRRLDKSDMKHKFVLLGSYGFFGYFGYYLDTESWEMIKLYCKQWDNFIEIIDVYENKYIVSSPDADDLVNALVTASKPSES